MSSPVSLKWSGGKSMRTKLLKLQIDFDRHRIPEAMKAEAGIIMDTSQSNHVPVAMGVLRDSGQVDKVIKVAKIFSIRLSYGKGAAKAHAKAVHEHLSKHSPPSWLGTKVTFKPSGRGTKYLERPIRDAAPGFASAVSRRLRV